MLDAIAAPGRALVRTALPLALQPRDQTIGCAPLLDDAALADQYKGKRVLIVGGTRGIGAATARVLEAAGGEVTVVGRSAAGASGVAADLSTVAGCLEAASQLKQRMQKRSLGFVIFTVGVWPDALEPRTRDNIDKVVALDLLARHIILTRLADAGALAVGCRVMSVLASCQHYPAAMMDAESVRRRVGAALDVSAAPGRHSLKSAALTLLTTAVAHDAWLHHLGGMLCGRLSPSSSSSPPVRLVATFPGLLVTDLPHTALPGWLADCLKLPLALVADSPEQVGRAHASILASPSLLRTSEPVSYHVAPLLEARCAHPLAYDASLGEWVYDLLEGLVARGAAGSEGVE